MSKKPNLDAMSVDEIWQLHEELILVLSERLASEKRQLEKRLEQLRREQEVSRPDKLKNAPKVRRKYPSVFPRFRNSSEPFETWSGRGKQPRWLTAALGAGRTIDEFAIGDLEPIRTPPGRKRSVV
jgi:DNA-binding protein H-NS